MFKIQSDGACLFNAISQAFDKANKSEELRSTVAAMILSDPKYDKKFLGGAMEPEAYAEFICKPKEWGGMPELRMLSEYYKARITVVDIGANDLVSFGPTG